MVSGLCGECGHGCAGFAYPCPSVFCGLQAMAKSYREAAGLWRLARFLCGNPQDKEADGVAPIARMAAVRKDDVAIEIANDHLVEAVGRRLVAICPGVLAPQQVFACLF
ncbi:MAG: hypothetical protein A3H88_03925 [Candidatus Blackburnbacteria bacterium RIFCSPLOWO2_02_FULL_44_9]|nr:MAG: hypothetical protein A3H88_03925 [Candidatus Blackburnbacteria bacterium RIFCSPLOWO2_02_FULL_44_9]